MNLNVTLETAWSDTERSLSPRTRQRMPGLKRFLAQLENPHARLLSGRESQDDTAAPDLASETGRRYIFLTARVHFSSFMFHCLT